MQTFMDPSKTNLNCNMSEFPIYAQNCWIMYSSIDIKYLNNLYSLGKDIITIQLQFCFLLEGEFSHTGNNPKKEKKKKKKGEGKSGGANDTKDFILKRNETQGAIL